MSETKHAKIVKGISTSILFDMSEPARVYDEQGPAAYIDYMAKNADEPLPLGPYFKQLKSAFNAHSDFMEVVICSRNSPLTARRAINTLTQNGITPERMIFTSGKSPVPFLKAYGILQFHTTNLQDAQDAMAEGIQPMYHDPQAQKQAKVIALNKSDHENVISLSEHKASILKEKYNGQAHWHYVFDLDGVVFDQEGEKYFQEAVKDFGFEKGLQKYRDYMRQLKQSPMKAGPAFNTLKTAADINSRYAGKQKPLILSIVTAQGAEAAIRAIETLHAWGIEFNGSAHFLAGGPKQEILRIMQQQSEIAGVPCEFADDQAKNIEQAKYAGMFAGRVLGFGLENS